MICSQNDRRLAMVRAMPELIACAFVEGATTHVRCVCGVPSTARLVGSHHDLDRGCFSLVFEDEGFGSVQEGDAIPVLVVRLESTLA